MTDGLGRPCVFPDCLTLEQSLRLVGEIGCELLGETCPDPDVYDQRDACRCVDGHAESGR